MYVVKSEAPAGQGAGARLPGTEELLLEPLDEVGPMVRFTTVPDPDTVAPAGAERYRRVLEVHGTWTGEAGYAVFAEWQVGGPAQEPAYIESRRQLFAVRRVVLPSFAVDWLLQHLDQPGRYLVLGLYGDEEGMRLCRDHPEVRRFSQAHPAAAYGATDVSGLRFFRVRR